MKNLYRSSCGMCHGGCGVLVHTRNGKVTRLEGDPASPLSRGNMCAKGLASLQHLYHPARLKYPLQRKGPRGAGAWQRISWDEALNTIVDKLIEIKKRYGAEGVAIGQGTGRHHFRDVVRFANAFGTPNWCEPGTAQCFHPRVTASRLTFGDFIISDHYGDRAPGCILVWGHNPAVTGPDGEIGCRFLESLKKGAKLIVVDPRLSETASKADIWLRIRPGTDAALALALMNVMISEDLYDREFIEKWTIGFNRLSARIQDCTPQWAQDITWIPVSQIKKTARMLAATRPFCLEWGVALEHTPNCLQNMRSLAVLVALMGDLDSPGGNTFGMHAVNPYPLGYDRLPPEMHARRLGADQFKLLSNKEAGMASAHSPTLFKAMRTGKPYPVKAFLIFGNNALLTYANTKEVYQTLMALDFMVVTDIYMTPTAQLANLVLPAATWLEQDTLWGYPIRADNVVLARQKITQIGEAKQDEDILIELARRLNLSFGTESIEETINYQLQPLSVTFSDLKERGYISVPVHYHKYVPSGFKTPSGKVELYSSELQKLGYDPLPDYHEPPESPLSAPQRASKFPLILTTGGRSPVFFHSEGRQIPDLRETHPIPLVDIHPATAAKMDINDGDWVWIETARGKIKQKARLTHGIDERVVHVQHGWWFPEKEEPEYGFWESNANVLTDNGPPYDPALGTYQLRALLCRISKET
jgi:anaerobic selenocysteine-containing dehydrogenase